MGVLASPVLASGKRQQNVVDRLNYSSADACDTLGWGRRRSPDSDENNLTT